MSDVKARAKPVGYEEDFYAWSQDQGARLRAREPRDIDWENVAEEVESVGRSQKTEIRSRLAVLLTHLLKWEFQPEARCASWQSSIGEQRTHIETIIEDSPSLRRFPTEAADRAHRHARSRAARETGLPIGTFPATLPYSAKQLLDDAFMPGRRWEPADLRKD